jgi:DNA uptake protein ComE-like DNA-binding protein
MLPKWFREHLSFHRTERNGVIALCIALLLLIGYNIYQRVFWKSKYEEIQLEFGEEILTFTEKQDSIQTSTGTSNQPWLPKAIEYFNFDPNTLDSAGWVKLGFSPKQSAAILKYVNAGAVFRKPEDVKKLFVVDDEKYAELEAYITIKQLPNESKPRKEFKAFEPKNERKFEPLVVELNSADTTQLQQLYGIGSSFAKRIVKYRELLGGYTSKEQVLEVYGMDSARYLPIKESLLVDTTYRVRININTADFKTLLRHPYLDKNQVKAIVNYRKQHGSFQSVDRLQRIHLLKGEPYRKIAPYLTVQ